MQLLEKILANQPLDIDASEDDGPPKQAEFIPQADQQTKQNMFEKIIGKLLEYNERINSGKEISLIEYLKELDQRSDFVKEFNN